VLQVAAHLALPVLALVMLQAGSLTRYVRASMLDVVKMDFIRTARAKGLQERVILKHALRNALPDHHPAGLRAAGAVLRGDHYRKGIQLAGAGIFISTRWPPATIRC
jgi:ABC-type dipeptide/oligopeptide/nickel transport system permease component